VNEKAGLETLSPAFPDPVYEVAYLGRPRWTRLLAERKERMTGRLWLAKLGEPLRDDISM
jgi:hypothetical protein